MYDLVDQVLCYANQHTAPELPEEVRESNVKRIITTITEILRISRIARREGLLALEEYADNYIVERNAEEIFLKKAVLFIVDGLDPEFVRQILGGSILVCGIGTFQGYLNYLCLEGILAVQAGENPRVIEEKMLAWIPLNLQIRAKQAIDQLNQTENKRDDRILREESLHMEVYNSAEARALFLSILEEKILHLSEEQLIRVIEKINVEELGALLPKVREEVRVLLFRYLTKEQIQDMLVDSFEWHRISLAEALAGITAFFQQMEKNGEI